MEHYVILGNLLNVGLLKLMGRAQLIGSSLVANPRFTKSVQAFGSNLKSAVSTLKIKNDSYELTPTALNKQLRDESKQLLESRLRAAIVAVNAEAKGDLDRLVSSGFELNNARRTVSEAAPAPEFIDLFVYPKQPGTVEFKIAKVGKLSDYVVTYRALSDKLPGAWQNVLSATTGRITRLESGVFYEFRASAINTYSKKHNEYNYSSISQCVIQ